MKNEGNIKVGEELKNGTYISADWQNVSENSQCIVTYLYRDYIIITSILI